LQDRRKRWVFPPTRPKEVSRRFHSILFSQQQAPQTSCSSSRRCTSSQFVHTVRGAVRFKSLSPRLSRVILSPFQWLVWSQSKHNGRNPGFIQHLNAYIARERPTDQLPRAAPYKLAHKKVACHPRRQFGPKARAQTRAQLFGQLSLLPIRLFNRFSKPIICAIFECPYSAAVLASSSPSRLQSLQHPCCIRVLAGWVLLPCSQHPSTYCCVLPGLPRVGKSGRS
jgi:hypothetical protein